MIELPEAITISKQLNENVQGKRIINVTAAHIPHKFAWYHGDPQKYYELLVNKVVSIATGFGSMVEIRIADVVVLLSEGAGIRYHLDHDNRPQKHQLLIEFEDFSAISVTVQMYGGILCFAEGDFQNQYYIQSKVKPSPLSEQFDRTYFDGIITACENRKISVKALLATGQRIPGLGNGVLQDILFHACTHPKKTVISMSEDERENLFQSVKKTMAEMTFQGGRDTEKDLFGCFGGYKTKCSKNTVNSMCERCGSEIRKEAYMGGSIYYCGKCQKL